MQTDLMRGALEFVDNGPFDVAHRASFDAVETTRPSDTPRTGRPLRRVDLRRRSESFGARLRRVREHRRISIASIAESTKILGALLEGVENDDVSRWPTGLYRRAFMRAYATAIGLDPEPIVREFIARFPDPEDTPAPVPAAAAAAPLPGTRAVLRLTLAEPGGTFAGGDLLCEARRRVVAIAADAVVVGGIAGWPLSGGGRILGATVSGHCRLLLWKHSRARQHAGCLPRRIPRSRGSEARRRGKWPSKARTRTRIVQVANLCGRLPRRAGAPGSVATEPRAPTPGASLLLTSQHI